ncbi:hypothetical protein DENSPDRAFT_927033 [Dentipellis sp. KUC8613]|nr:hypothetical protein DENSPDRAFT_927033 [Dentipellis sp. KUC8613]
MEGLEPALQKSSTTGTQSFSSRSSRVYFPATPRDPSPSDEAEGSGKPSSIGLGPPPALRRSPATQDNLSSGLPRHDHARRRVRSAHVGYSNSLGAPQQPAQRNGNNGLSGGPRKRTVTSATSSRASKYEASVVDSRKALATEDASVEGFSEEYDLSHEDPQILEDVQRALTLKVRREARIQAMQGRESPYSSGSSQVRTSLTPASPINTRLKRRSAESEVDFSPSVGIDRSHPVPTLLDDGRTLDWGAPPSEDEKPDKKWSLSIPKRKSKDKEKAGDPDRDTLGKQESLYAEKLRRISASAKPQTLKKAQITRDQLRRRYKQLNASASSKADMLNPVKAVRWYASSEPLLQSSLDQAEPLPWLKHLRERRGIKNGHRFNWYLTALIVEEYSRNRTRRDTMETIPEDLLPPNSGSLSPPFQYPVPTSQGSSPYMASVDNDSYKHLEASLSRRRSLDGHVSFEPVVDSSGRRSLGSESRRSVDAITRGWRQSLPGVESPRGSIYSSIFGGSTHSQPYGGTSPTSSRIHLRDLVSRRGRRRGNDSDDASSSHHDHSGVSDDYSRSDEGGVRKRKRTTHHFRPADLDLFTRTQPVTDSEVNVTEGAQSDSLMVPERPASADFPLTAKALSPQDGASQADVTSSMAANTPRLLQLRGFRTSLPSSEKLSIKEEAHRQQQVDEEREQHEYEQKAEILDNTIAQNHRNRQLLQRIAVGVKEYEAVQSRMAKIFGHSYVSLPPELLDAFSHDPAVVTGSTKWLRGWRAVENIHDHISSQVDTVQAFLHQMAEQPEVTRPASLLEGPLSSLQRSLEALEGRRASIIERSQEVEDTLLRIKELHTAVKTTYNKTLAHTSSVYPELSQIVALEESYRDQYQQLWEFGMDALTFLLDTVTPVWRNYGKVIGIDVQDFLIIPWYRNEFTGEDNRYPIKALPTRSFRHWIGLIVLFFTTVLVLVLQARAAWTFCSFYRLPFITSTGLWWTAVPFFLGIAIVQWVAVLIEASIVAAQVAVVVWWIGWWAKIFD